MTYTKFNTNCSLPDASVNYFESPNVRGTFGIIWSCAGVLVACVYTVQHRHLPWDEQHYSPDVRKYRSYIKFFAPLLLSAFTLLVPEWVYGNYIFESLVLRRQLRALQKYLVRSRETPSPSQRLRQEHQDWTLAHVWFAEMGGFVVKCVDDQPDDQRLSTTSSDVEDGRRAIGCHVRDNKSSAESGSALETVSSPTAPVPTAEARNSPDSQADGSLDGGQRGSKAPSPPKRRPLHLTAFVLRKAIEEGYVSTSAVPLDKIMAFSKSDWFAKALVTLQLIQFTTTIVARLVEKLPISPLEVSTASFAICSLTTYCFLLSKAKDPTGTITLWTSEKGYKRIMIMLVHEYSSLKELTVPQDQVPEVLNAWTAKVERVCDRPSIAGLTVRRDNGDMEIVILGVIGALFGAIHLAGWDLDFPTGVDQWLWRSAAILTTAVPTIVACLRRAEVGTRFETFQEVFLLIALPFYVIGRLIILVEMFRTLFYLPPLTFSVASWPANIPHFS